ncbi:glycosyltransferase [Isoptericola sp. NEAU-Y5]|uniref:Glycosyltransferase n=1 Tax=Isoptericola luteus TaxID=2879484 RepID=A0ABS7ZCX4_9MICO|nr:glycosyltransferase [Isoptericola sp. NEAU-Y5]MCA5892768.1 glycosyltransferase [Isoptericola sp. NEAU-Y5]
MTAQYTIGTRRHGEVAPQGAAGSTVPSGTSGAAAPHAVAVTAVVVTRGRTPFLPATLDALTGQERGADEVVVVDVGAHESTSRHEDLRLGQTRFVAASGARTLGEAVDRAVRAVGTPDGGWLWILHDDSLPEPDALSRLLRAVEHSSAVAVAGCKQRRWDLDRDGSPSSEDTGALIEVGSTVSGWGRRMTGIDDTEIDQGQHDGREDVLAVGLAGALVRGSVWAELGGTDPEVGPFGDGLDLCRRARLAGHRVVVVPGAVVRHAQASLRGLRDAAPRGAGRRTRTAPDDDSSRYARRRSQLYLRLAWAPLPAVPVLWLAMLLWSPFAAMYRLALKRPALARDELRAAVVTALRLVPLYRARRRATSSRRLPRRVLAPLLGTVRQVSAERRDVRLARAEAHRNRWAPSELERAELRRLARARRLGLALVLACVTGLAVALFGPWQGILADGGRIVGGGLLPAPGTVGDVWDAATSGWVRDGLGTAAGADPLLLPLTAFTALAGGGVQTAVNALVMLALPLAALAGWFAAGALTRNVAVRAAAALVWAAAPGLGASLATGRIGAVLAHLALPWVLLAVVRTVGAQARDVVDLPVARPPAPRRRGSLGAAGAAGLLLAVAVCAAPVLLPVAVLAIGATILAVPRSWRSLLLVLVPSVVLPLPFWGHVLGEWSDGGWRLLVAEPGAPVVAEDTPTGLELLTGLPGDTSWFGLGDADGALGALGRNGPALLGVVVLGLAVVALLRRVVARGVRLAWFGAVVGLATALAAVATAVASGTTADGTSAAVTGWPGPGLSVLLLGLGAAAACGVGTDPLAALRGDSVLRRAGSGVLVALGVLGLALPVAQLVSWTLDVDRGSAVGALRADAGPVVPAVGQQLQAAPRAARVLQVDRVQPGVADGTTGGTSGGTSGGTEGGDARPVVDYTILHADGSRLQDSSTVVRARAAGLLPGGERADVALADDLVADVVSGRSPDVAARLAAAGIGAVQVPAGGDPDLVTTLDLVPGLARVTEGGPVVWRVTTDGPAAGWATVVTGAPAEAAEPGAPFAPPDARGTLDADGMGASGDVGAVDAERALRVAATADRGWHATLDGRRLVAVDAGGLQAFAVPADAGRLDVGYTAPHRTAWLTLAAVVLLVHVLLALPVGRRRGRGSA